MNHVRSGLKKIANFISQYLFFVDDVHDYHAQDFERDLKINNQFSSSYILLLVSSSVIATLGLLQDSAPVIIGGMIISPLMWPLLLISFAITFDKKFYVKKSLTLLVASICITLITAYIITIISPLKVVNNEIISRTNPILPDILIAMFGGLIAAFGLARKRISSSLAGVAMATSLMPPLCVVGIGIALGSSTIALGALLLFFTNCVAIIFISVLAFIFIQLRNDEEHDIDVQKRSIALVTTILIILLIPLTIFMQRHVYNITISDRVAEALQDEIREVAPDVEIRNVAVTFSEIDRDFVDISADLISSQTIDLTFAEEVTLKNRLKNVLEAREDINIRFTNQNILQIKSETDIQAQAKQEQVREFASLEITTLNPNVVINEISARKTDDVWNINAIVYSNPENTFTYSQLDTIEKNISEDIAEQAVLKLTVLPLLVLTNDLEDISEEEKRSTEAQKEVESFLTTISSDIEVNLVDIRQDSITTAQDSVAGISSNVSISGSSSSAGIVEPRPYVILVKITKPVSVVLEQGQVELLTQKLKQILEADVSISMQISSIDVLSSS